MRPRSSFSFWLTCFATALLLYVAYVLRHALLLIVVAILIAILLDPVVVWISSLRISKWSPSRGASVFILSVAIILIVSLIIIFVVPTIAGNAQQMKRELPGRLNDLLARLGHKIPTLSQLNGQDLMARAKSYFQSNVGLGGVLNGFIALLTVLLLAAYFSIDKDDSIRWALSLFPKRNQRRIERTMRHGSRRTQRWLQGQGLLMLAHGGSALIAFWALGLDYFYVLALFAGIINIIPVVGPVATLVVAGIVAAAQGATKMLGVFIFYLVYHSTENALLNPRIMENRVHLPAVTVVAALVIGEALAGIVGMLISVPAAVLISEFISEYVSCDESV